MQICHYFSRSSDHSAVNFSWSRNLTLIYVEILKIKPLLSTYSDMVEWSKCCSPVPTNRNERTPPSGVGEHFDAASTLKMQRIDSERQYYCLKMFYSWEV